MWERLSIGAGAVLGVMGTVTTFFGEWKFVWVFAFYAVIASAMYFARKAVRDAEKESDERHAAVMAATTGGDNFAYVEPVKSAPWGSSKNGTVSEKISVTHTLDGGKRATFKVSRGPNMHQFPWETLLELGH